MCLNSGLPDVFSSNSKTGNMKLTIGSVQFGLPYGISNVAGQVSPCEVEKILNVARRNNIDTIDTAIAYGDSESVLGLIGVNDFKVVTKLPILPDKSADIIGWVEKHIEESLIRLNKTSIHGLLVHHAESLEGSDGKKLGFALGQIKISGLVEKVGVSIYQPSVLDKIMENASIDIVQAPLNVVDTSIISSGWLDKLDEAGVEVHVRSIFMQGLLLMDRTSIPDKFNQWMPLWDHWHENLSTYGLGALSECISFVNSFSKVSRVVVGIESALQLQQVLGAIDLSGNPLDWSQMTCHDDMLINPSNWTKL